MPPQVTIPFASIGPHTRIPSRSRFVGPERIWLGDAVFMEESVAFDTANLLFNESPRPLRIRVGNRVTIGRHALISSTNWVEIGNNVLLAQNVYIADNDHHYTDVGIPIRDQFFSGYRGSVVVEDDCWLGRNAVVIGSHQETRIGRGSVVAANAVVTSSVPAYSVAAGNPGRVVKMYDPSIDDWVRVERPKDVERVLAGREKCGVHPRPVHVDLGRFHHLVPACTIDGADGAVLGAIVESPSDSGWKRWTERYLSTLSADAPVCLVLGIPSREGSAALDLVSAHVQSATTGDPTPDVVVQPFDDALRPQFLRALSALLVDPDDPVAERQSLEAMASGIPVIGRAGGRVGRWLKDGVTGLAGDDGNALLGRVVSDASSLEALGQNARALLERTFGVPHVTVGEQAFHYTAPSDRLGL